MPHGARDRPLITPPISPFRLTGVANGDVVQFQFLDKNHTVTQSTFAAPCSNITDATGTVTGVDSGFQFVDPAATSFPVWQITVNNASTPLWFYCRQAKYVLPLLPSL